MNKEASRRLPSQRPRVLCSLHDLWHSSPPQLRDEGAAKMYVLSVARERPSVLVLGYDHPDKLERLWAFKNGVARKLEVCMSEEERQRPESALKNASNCTLKAA